MSPLMKAGIKYLYDSNRVNVSITGHINWKCFVATCKDRLTFKDDFSSCVKDKDDKK